MRRSVVMAAAVVLLAAVQSCHRINLYSPSSGVYLDPNVILGPKVELTGDVDIDGDQETHDKAMGEMPTQVHACFYDIQTHALVYEDYVPSTGGFIGVGAGEYDLVVYGLGTRTTRVDGTGNRGSGRGYTSYSDTRISLTKADSGEDGERYSFQVIYEPDHIFVGRRERVEVPVTAGESEIVRILVDMPTLLETYTFEAFNIIGLERVTSVKCYVTGQAPCRYFWDERYPPEPHALEFSAKVDLETGSVKTVFNTFGKIPGAGSRAFVTLYLSVGSGEKYQYVYDVTDQFDNPDNVGHEIVVTEPIIIPEGGGQGGSGGFDLGVTQWIPDISYFEL